MNFISSLDCGCCIKVASGGGGGCGGGCGGGGGGGIMSSILELGIHLKRGHFKLICSPE